MSAVRKIDLAKVAFRLAFLQSVWREGAMQSEGLAWCLLPGLRRLYGDPDSRAAALRRYRGPFNTHPFLAGVIAGAVLRLEQEGTPSRRISSFVGRTMGGLAAAGDPFFRDALAPAVTLLAALTALLAGPLEAIAVLVVLFNTVHIGVRLAGVRVGFRRGTAAPAQVARWIGTARVRRIKVLGAVAGGLVLWALATRWSGELLLPVGILAGLAGLGAAAAFVARRALAAPLVLALLLAALLSEVLL